MSRFRHIFIPAILFLAAWSATLRAQDWKNYPYTPDGSLISFPVDEGWHPDEAIEWWYMAGHLKGTASGTPYSFMLTYFYFPGDTLGISYDGFRILNISNDQTGVFHTETMALNYVDLATDHLHIDARLLNYVIEYWNHKEETDGTLVPFEYELSATAGQNSIALATVSQKPPLIPGGDGLFDQGADSYTYYYSLTENLVEGTLTFEGNSVEVTGSAWIDRQYGTFNPNTGEQYEWFYLQLSNGMDLNIWNLFTLENQLPENPAYKHISVYMDTANQYTSHDFKLEQLAYACISDTGNCYAREWRLTSPVNQLDLTFSTLHHNSEVEIPFSFFEGPTTATGSVNGSPVTGIGFAELVKSYEAPQIRITRPGREWNENFPIQWEVQNPDDGRPLLFDLEYSTDQAGSWLPIVQEHDDTLYYWNDHSFVNGDSCLFRVTGYTADKTLLGVFEASTHTLYDDQYTFTNREPAPAFRVYPNPAGNTLWIEWEAGQFETGETHLPYKVIDFTGRQVIEGILSKGEVDVSLLDEGAYMIIVHTPTGITNHTFIKK